MGETAAAQSPLDGNGVGLTAEQLALAFPFHLAVGADLRIVQAGPSLLRACPDVALGDDVRDRFSLRQPGAGTDFRALCAGEGAAAAVWEHKKSGLRFQGRLLPAADRRGAAFLGAPVLADAAALDRHGLRPADFPPHDPTVGLLLALQSNKIALQDERDLAEKLSEQRAELLHANAELSRQFSKLWEELVNLKQIEAETFKIALIANNTGHAVVMTDAEGRVEWVNDSFTHITGYSLHDMLGKTPGSVLQGEKTDRETVEYIRSQFDKGESFGAELVNYSKSGREYWIQFEVQPIRDEDGAVTNWMSIERDITEQKKSELALLEATRAAEAANRAKSAFLATMSHEIRTPMNAVLGTLSLLLDSRLDDEQGLWVTSAYHAARSLLDIIEDVLDFSKIEAGKLTLQHENFDLPSLIEDIIQLFRIRADAKGLALASAIDPATPARLRGDPYRLRQVLVNLVGNAVKFTERGGVFVGVSCQRRGAGKIELRFHVRDSGIGIPEDSLNSLFNQFVQVDSRVSRRYGGTGLGLAISKRLANLMEGDIGVSSRLGEGSEFWFTAQLTAPDAPPHPAEAFNGASPNHAHSLGRRMSGGEIGKARPKAEQRLENAKILVAEDGEINRLVVTAMLGKAGYQVEVAQDGAKAVEAASAGDYDLILMDLQMPEMDGYQATAAIRRLDGPIAQVPILAFTATALQEDLDACLAAGMNDFVAKPVERDRLMASIAHWLRKKAETPPPASAPAGAKPGQAALLDRDTLQSLAVQTDEQTMRDTVDIFFTDTARRMEKLAQALVGEDFQTLGFEAHSIKSAAMTIGALRLAQGCKNLEAACGRRDRETALRVTKSLKGIFEESRAAFIGVALDT